MEARASVRRNQLVPDRVSLTRRGMIFDGSGAPPFHGEVRIAGDTIVDVVALDEAGDDHASLPCIAPGFIDIHSHADHFLLIDPSAESKLLQGVTTDVIGNCGYSAAPLNEAMRERRRRGLARFRLNPSWRSFGEYLKRLEDAQPALNVVALVGHGTIRSFLGIPDGRPASADERRAIAAAVEEALDEGAAGVSTGTFYAPGAAADRNELIAAIEPTRARGALYSAHIRDEGDRLLEALDEACDVVNAAGARFQLSHVKTWKRRNWPKGRPALERIRKLVECGVDFGMDLYPYTSAATELIAGAGLRGLASTDALRAAIETMLGEDARWPSRVRILSTSVEKFRGRKLSDFDDPVKAVIEIVQSDPHASAAFEELSESAMHRFMKEPYAAIGSDASNRSIAGPLAFDAPHPRAFGTFPRFLSRFCGDGRLMSMEEGIRRVTSLPASRLGIVNRGAIKTGNFADIVIFDAKALSDRATFRTPKAAPSGILEVFVNGRLAASRGSLLPIRAGRCGAGL